MLIFDIETDGLLETVSRIHCLWIYDTDTGKYLGFSSARSNIEAGLRLLQNADVICGHNIINYDIPAIRKLYPWFTHGKLLDTLVMSRLIYPDIDDTESFMDSEWELAEHKLVQSHSLKAWGIRLGFNKGNYGETESWDKFNLRMYRYCRRDVKLTRILWEHLKSQQYSEKALDLELSVAQIIQRQVAHGWAFNERKAQKLYGVLLQRKTVLHEQLVGIFGSWYARDKTVVPKVSNKKRGIVKGCEYTKLKLVTFNPNSRQHIAYVLRKRHGWVPQDFTKPSKQHPHGQPKIDEEIIKALPYYEAPLIAEYLMIQKRLGQLADGQKGWLKLVKNGRIYGQVQSCGAVTRRMTHSNPNVAQVPHVGSPYGAECRELFEADPGTVLVGCDASGLEARVQGHYMFPYDNGEFANAVIYGNKADGTDFHTKNMRAFGLTDRDLSKTVYYAMIYGAGDAKLGRTATGKRDINENIRRGRELRRNFERNTPAYAKLKAAVLKAVADKGYLLSIDGHPLRVRSEHSALNTLFQSCGAIIMKRALVLLDESLKKLGIRYEFVGNIHDEFQMVVDPDFADLVGFMSVAAIRAAGEYYGLRCPLDGEFRVGQNWRDTH